MSNKIRQLLHELSHAMVDEVDLLAQLNRARAYHRTPRASSSTR